MWIFTTTADTKIGPCRCCVWEVSESAMVTYISRKTSGVALEPQRGLNPIQGQQDITVLVQAVRQGE